MFCLGIQGAAHSINALNFLRYITTSETRSDFLNRNVAGYQAVQWINSHLKPSDKVLIYNRNLHFLVEVPTYYAHVVTESLVDLRPEANDPLIFDKQLRTLGITHLLTPPFGGLGAPPAAMQMWQPLVKLGCARAISNFDFQAIGSRTFQRLAEPKEKQFLIQIGRKPCREKP